MSEPFEILVVCLGNVCRSPFAERLMQLRFAQLLGPEVASEKIHISSAGTRAAIYSPMDELAAAELEKLGGDPGGFGARRFSPEMADGADLVLTATQRIRSRILGESPRALRRTFTIPELAGIVYSHEFRKQAPDGLDDLVTRAASFRGSVDIRTYDVPDPIDQSPRVHRKVAGQLDRDCTAIAKVIARVLADDNADGAPASSTG